MHLTIDTKQRRQRRYKYTRKHHNTATGGNMYVGSGMIQIQQMCVRRQLSLAVVIVRLGLRPIRAVHRRAEDPFHVGEV